MRQERNNIFAGIDWILVFLFFTLIGFGWMNIYAASKSDEQFELFNFSTKYGKQFIFILLTIPLAILILFFNSKFYEKFASIFYVVSLLSLIGLFIFGKEINGARSWYNFGVLGLQPSEFVKAFTALAVAKLLTDRQYNLKLLKNQIKAFIIIFTPALLITLQPDAGSALIYLAFFFVLNREGLTLNYILFGSLAIIIFILSILFGYLWVLCAILILLTIITLYITYKGGKGFLRFNWHYILIAYSIVTLFIFGTNFTYNNIFKQHHRDRFEVLLGLKTDNKNIGYNSYQSELTISSGGLSGKGFLNGDITKGNFVPEQHTDYIFSTVGEEWGFIGSILVIILFMLMLYRIIYLSETHSNKFGRIYGYGVASILLFHVIVNIGMVIGLLPTVGIPLPFFSYGGSSLWGFTILLFIFIRLDAHKKYDW
ncbi:rod shape-determining protein RodA [Polaribacter sargassicola]|uniref:rod shape-determining protein RodA n=1 Tax=Polaribacter sargassicola TaxID=2836891 RepID=UPI001F020377|nr:rod shape-determining protein RodA [Polaribacter sp. DS7-9]MCG1035906.1 rod shape-determining protein RodA [Polaribacter sp. DS7-9]